MKAQAAAAQELKREREEQERRERRARATEAAEAEKLRRRSKRKRDSEDEYWDRWDGRTADRKRTSSSRNWDDNWSGYEDGNRSRRRRRRTGDHPRSRSKELSSQVPSHHSSPSPRRSRSRELSPRVSSRHSSPSLGPQPPVQLPSKMDRYFEESYDPRLDVAPLSAPKVPATGLINNAEFEGWDAMLELIRVRREDKEEKKRLDRLGLSKEKVKVKKNVSISSSAAVADRWSSEGVSVLDIEYKKRGSVREWDVGKEEL